MRHESIHPPSEDLFAYRDGELLPEKRTLIEAHVMGCSTCRSFIDQVSSLEAELRQSPDRAPAEYLERLHEGVRARIAAAGTPAIAAAEGERLEDVPAAADAHRIPAWAGRERRGNGAEGTDEDVRGKAPRLPWAAVISTASAAAAVVVVAVILLKQGIGQRPIRPEPPLADRAPVEADQPKEVLGRRAEQKLDAKSAEPSDRLAKNQDLKALSDQANAPAAEKPAGQAAAGSVQERGTIQHQEETQEAPPERSDEEGTRSAAPKMSFSASGYEELMSRFGLPPVWDGARVTPEALQRAEPELRSLYVSGGAGADSARIRLYLAEAVRLRYAPGDSTQLQEIEHHYRRAIELAGPDTETARIAQERLQTLER